MKRADKITIKKFQRKTPLSRVPLYFRVFEDLEKKGTRWVTGDQISELVGLSKATCQKDFDLMARGKLGIDGVGYRCRQMMEVFHRLLSTEHENGDLSIVGNDINIINSIIKSDAIINKKLKVKYIFTDIEIDTFDETIILPKKNYVDFLTNSFLVVIAELSDITSILKNLKEMEVKNVYVYTGDFYKEGFDKNKMHITYMDLSYLYNLQRAKYKHTISKKGV